MKAGYTAALRRRIETPARQARLVTELLATHAEDVRRRKDQWDLGTLTNVETWDSGEATIAGSTLGAIEHTAGAAWVTDLDNSEPFDALAWEIPDTYGDEIRLRKVELYLTRRRDSGAAAFDGSFLMSVFRVPDISYSPAGSYGAHDCWRLAMATAPYEVRASSLASDTQLVAFTFGGAFPPPRIDGSFRPTLWDDPLLAKYVLDRITGRLIVVLVWASGGTNTNYGWGRDAAEATVIPGTSGTLRHRLLHPRGGMDAAGSLGVTDGTGMVRAALSITSLQASGTLQLSGAQQLDLGATPAGTVEFVVQADVPAHTTLVTKARVSSGDGWTTVQDGQTPADVGLAVSRTYEMQAVFAANSALDTSPTLRALGIRDRTALDVSELATLEGFDESVDPVTGQVKMAEGTCRLELLGQPDARDLVTEILSGHYFSDLEVRCFAASDDLPRAQWLHLDTWRLDDYEPGPTAITLTLVSVLERLRGDFPAASGTLYGYLLKAAASDLSGGADFSAELSETAETAGTRTVSVAAGATETSYAFTPPGVPGLLTWMTGDWVVKVDVTTAHANIVLAVRLRRVNAAGAVQESSPAPTSIDELSLASTGVKTFTANLGGLTWTKGADTDRLRVDFLFRNTDGGSAHSVAIATGTINAEVRPPWIPTAAKTPVKYSADTLPEVYDDWLDGRIGLEARYRGPGPATVTTILTKTVEPTDGKRELERIAYLDGGTVIGSQGAVKFVNLYAPRDVVQALFPLEEQAGQRVALGLRARLPRFTVPYGYGTTKENAFAGEVQTQHAAALAHLGLSRIDNPDARLEDATARYIPDPTLAALVGGWVVNRMGGGITTVDFAPIYAQPHLEIGDAVAVETDQLVLRNAVTGEAIRGARWVAGVVIGRKAVWGAGFTVWIRGAGDLSATAAAIADLATLTAPTNLQLTSHTSAPEIRASWTAPDDRRVLRYEVQAKRGTEADWRTVGYASLDVLAATVSPVASGAIWSVRVRALGRSGASAWLEGTHTAVIDAAATFSVTDATNGSAITYHVTLGATCAYVEFYTREHAASGGADPSLTQPFFAGRLERSGDFTIATTASAYRRTRILGYDVNGVAGQDSGVIESHAAAIGTPPSAAPSGIALVTAHPTTLDISWGNAGDTTSVTRIWVDGVVWYTSAAGDTTATLTGLNRGQTYQVDADHFRNGQASALDGAVAMATTAVEDAPASLAAGDWYGAEIGPKRYGNFDLTWADTGAWELWESASSDLGSGAPIASGASGTTHTLTKLQDTPGGWYYSLRGTDPLTAFVACAENPLNFQGA